MNAWFIGVFLITLAAIVLLDIYTEAVSISAVSRAVFNNIINMPYLALFPVALGVAMFYITQFFLKRNLYLDGLSKQRSSQVSTSDIPFLRTFGAAGELAAVEIKLILRNKRPKSTLIMSAFFMLYGLLFYRGPELDGMIMVFAGLFMTGIFIINYGQFMFSWQSSHFDGILANRISAEDFFKSKILLFTLFSSVAFLLTIPYVYFGWKVLLAHAMLYLWNIGLSSLIVLAFANWNYKYIDLSKGSSFNWEGVGASQFIIGLPLFILPMFIYTIVKWLFNPVAALLMLGFIGLFFIVSRSFWLNKLLKSFKQKRYIIAEGFRNH
jgi:hypothetical protein